MFKIHIYMYTRIYSIDIALLYICVCICAQDTHLHVYTHLHYRCVYVDMRSLNMYKIHTYMHTRIRSHVFLVNILWGGYD